MKEGQPLVEGGSCKGVDEVDKEEETRTEGEEKVSEEETLGLFCLFRLEGRLQARRTSEEEETPSEGA